MLSLFFPTMGQDVMCFRVMPLPLFLPLKESSRGSVAVVWQRVVEECNA